MEQYCKHIKYVKLLKPSQLHGVDSIIIIAF